MISCIFSFLLLSIPIYLKLDESGPFIQGQVALRRDRDIVHRSTVIHNPSLYCLLLIESLIACLTLVVFKPRPPKGSKNKPRPPDAPQHGRPLKNNKGQNKSREIAPYLHQVLITAIRCPHIYGFHVIR